MIRQCYTTLVGFFAVALLLLDSLAVLGPATTLLLLLALQKRLACLMIGAPLLALLFLTARARLLMQGAALVNADQRKRVGSRPHENRRRVTTCHRQGHALKQVFRLTLITGFTSDSPAKFLQERKS